MKASFARITLRFAAALLGERHRHWASAMEAELETATAEGAPLRFALGCLVAAGRSMLTAEEGRFALASYALVLGVMLPIAALQIGCALFDLPYLYPGHQGLGGAVIDGSVQESRLRGVYQAAVPALALLQLLIGLGQVRIAWGVLDRNWPATLRWASLSLSASATLALFLGVLFIDGRQAVLQGVVLVIELLTLALVAQWHAQRTPVREHQPAR